MNFDMALRTLEIMRKDLEDLKREYDALHNEVVDANTAINEFHTPLYGDSTPQRIRSLVRRCHDHESREARLRLFLVMITGDTFWGNLDPLDLRMSEFSEACEALSHGRKFDFSKFLSETPET